ncbi:hypothetical protein HDV05_007171 [Chytridiales sp. JEL 0842]|nr:hypothetical protein HDV05_007171 [Chytridiales sp. JEL 0842]
MASDQQQGNWWDSLPAVISKPEGWSRDQVAELVKSGAVPGKDYLVVDVRRTDYGGGHVIGHVNAPAQSFHQGLPEFVEKYKNVPKVFFYCNSSKGRGTRCAGWYQDALNERKITTSQGLILVGGIKGWLEAFKDDSNLTEKYDAEFWKAEH